MRMDTQDFEFRLDNAAKIFPGMLSRRRTTMFRLAVDIDAPVKVELLQQAYEAMLVRCPYFRVELRRGLFWYYFEHNPAVPRVEAESRYPCLYLPYKKRGVFPHRVVAFRNRIAFEVAHTLTDGTGALAFLNGLLLEYLRRRGEEIDSAGSIIDCRESPDPQEYEESFRLQYQKGVPPRREAFPGPALRGKGGQAPGFSCD